MQRACVAIAVLCGCGSVSENKPDAKVADGALPMIDAAIDSSQPTCAQSPAMLKVRYRAENNANDHTSTYNGTQVGANFGYTPGKYGSAFLLDGSDDVVTINDGDFLWAAGSLTLEAWIKTTGTTTGGVVCKYACSNTCTTSNSTAYWCLYVTAQGNPSFDFRPDATGNISTTTATLATVNDGQWHHIVGVRDAAAMTATVYVDGALSVMASPVAAQFGAQTNADGDTDFIGIGATPRAAMLTHENYFAGAIDEVAIYHSALTAAQVTAIYVAPDGKCL